MTALLTLKMVLCLLAGIVCLAMALYSYAMAETHGTSYRPAWLWGAALVTLGMLYSV